MKIKLVTKTCAKNKKRKIATEINTPFSIITVQEYFGFFIPFINANAWYWAIHAFVEVQLCWK
ncbi:hypothetical protein T12_7026 [Trichinella patagoniensis]|uniref:Uncharacterized protein n=1 Tax=Trichinella patagoniensis TaxID=990121 RepID=A0A0V1A0E7_9BILA|nr:hypothetical protein T12_2366 [Trichinella patagoniensis]KRY18189.1 hypothetical protein T12_7026 [Trichinella patagoniensis]